MAINSLKHKGLHRYSFFVINFLGPRQKSYNFLALLLGQRHI